MIQNRRTLALLLGSVSLLIVSIGRAAVDLEKPSSKEDVSIQFPKGWTPSKVAGARTLLVALAPKNDKDDSGEFQASFSITQDAGARLDATAQQARLAKDVPGYKGVDPPTPVTINGLEGICFGGTFSKGSLKLRSRQYLFSTNDKNYIITFTCLASRWSTYLPQVEASVATFTLKK